ncbi:PWI domain-containing protein [Cardiosporidium cionae]|uniref:PWI domain-containing protein n=1 Tax=Cardiosporidium cionae TaxID=476202 RepID=A0ABQ7J5M9_9APIC|nr:PWI domain-containing protein [Cardiosporidium cionae]|eukprot:KAF8819311.1 PWI domain-containing protein [Cardiosporidium cionae]
MSGGPGFYRGTTHDQTPFFANKEKKMIESKKWPSSFSKKVDISKVSLDVMKPWISKRITELLGVEDEIVIDYCMSQLRPAESAMGELSSGDKDEISPKRLQINLTGFMAKSTGIFVKELWELLLSAQENPNGIPQQFLDEKKEEMQRMKEEQRRLQDEIEKRQEIYRLDNGNLDGPRRSNFSDALIIDTTTEKENDSSVKASKMEEKEDLSDTAAVKLAVEKETKAEISHKGNLLSENLFWERGGGFTCENLPSPVAPSGIISLISTLAMLEPLQWMSRFLYFDM